MSSAVSPLAPTHVPEMPVIAGVKLATAAAGIRYKGRTDVLLAVMDKGTTVAGVFTKSKCPSAPVEWCRAKLGRRSRRRALVVNSGNANAFTGKTGRQATTLTADDCRQGGGMQSERGVSRLHRRDRRTARRHQIQRRARHAGRAGRARRMDGRRQGDHDHRHLSEGRDRDREARQGQSHHQRHGQGLRHDRARHGDHAGLRVHRRADRGAARCSRCSRAASKTPSMPSPSMATPRPRIRCWHSPPALRPRTARPRSAAPATRA